MTIPFASVTVIGCGLIGGSLLRAVRETWPAVRLIAVDSDAATRDYVSAQSLADEMLEALPASSLQLEGLVVLAVPIPALEKIAAEMADGLASDAVVTDVASVKRVAVQAVTPHLPEGAAFIPGHPIAGSEKTGIAAASAQLFKGKQVILAPENPEMRGVRQVADFWRGLGAEVVFMPPDLHDRIYAAVSHLPQLLAFQVKALCHPRFMRESEIGAHTIELPSGFPSGGEADNKFFRLCHSDPALWYGIFNANKDNINNILKLYLEALHQVIIELKGSEHSNHSASARDVDKLIPYLIASCLISAVAREERALGIRLRDFAGTGFADFTSPLTQDPEIILERVSAHAQEVAARLEKFADLLGGWR